MVEGVRTVVGVRVLRTFHVVALAAAPVGRLGDRASIFVAVRTTLLVQARVSVSAVAGAVNTATGQQPEHHDRWHDHHHFLFLAIPSLSMKQLPMEDSHHHELLALWKPVEMEKGTETLLYYFVRLFDQWHFGSLPLVIPSTFVFSSIRSQAFRARASFEPGHSHADFPHRPTVHDTVELAYSGPQ